MEKLELLTRALQITLSPVTIFGRDEDAAHMFYLRLARQLHPDAGGGDFAFALLQAKWDSYNSNAPEMLRNDEIADVTLSGVSEVKTVRDASDVDLLENEVEVLEAIRSSPHYFVFNQLYPVVLRSEPQTSYIGYKPDLLLPQHLVTLADLSDFYFYDELDIKALGWIWRRLNWALSNVHRTGIVHGGVTPDNILIGPKEHDVVLANWYYASRNQEPLKAISSKWLILYPEVLRNERISRETLRLNTIPGLDFYMAAQVMLTIFPHMPDRLKDYFLALVTEPLRSVPTNSNLLIRNFDYTIYTLLGWRQEFIELPWFNWRNMRNE